MYPPQLLRPVLYATFLIMAVVFRMRPPETNIALDTFFMIFALGPLCVFLDLWLPLQTTKKRHHAETALRVAVLLALYSLILPGTAVAAASAGMVGHLVNFAVLYAAVALGLHKFVIRPVHWLRYDNRFHTGFLTAMVGAIVLELGIVAPLKGLGVWALAALVVGLQVGWRHALWYNASQEMQPAQHADVWPALAKNNDPAHFWLHLYRYTLQHDHGMPAAALGVLSLPTLLGYFTHGVVDLSKNKNHDFEENVKLAINQKEPRATFVWQLYPAAEAAGYIARIEEFVASAQTESMELPDL